MKQEEGAVRLILAAAEFSSFTYSQLTKTWHRALAAVLDCSSWWLAYPPPLFPRHRSARSVPGSLTPKISAAVCRHMAGCNWDQQNDTSANYPEKWWINAGSCRPQPCLLLSQEFAACLTAADTAKCVLSFSSLETSCQQLQSHKNPNKDIIQVHYPPSTYWIWTWVTEVERDIQTKSGIGLCSWRIWVPWVFIGNLEEKKPNKKILCTCLYIKKKLHLLVI